MAIEVAGFGKHSHQLGSIPDESKPNYLVYQDKTPASNTKTGGQGPGARGQREGIATLAFFQKPTGAQGTSSPAPQPLTPGPCLYFTSTVAPASVNFFRMAS